MEEEARKEEYLSTYLLLHSTTYELSVTHRDFWFQIQVESIPFHLVHVCNISLLNLAKHQNRTFSPFLTSPVGTPVY